MISESQVEHAISGYNKPESPIQDGHTDNFGKYATSDPKDLKISVASKINITNRLEWLFWQLEVI